MKIVIIAPSPIPFGIGGAEKLWWGMQEYINKNTTNQCELIKIPIKEDSFWNLVESYYKFYTLDLSHFDMIISTKYPAWMVEHSNHHIYLQHCLRGLYDTYHFTALPLTYSSKHPKVNKIIELLNSKDTSITQLFDSLFELKLDKTVPSSTYQFPAPFIRKIIHFLDKRAMQNISSFSAISQTVIDRKEYFPENRLIQKIYHPSNLTKLESISYDYFFTASRLDGAKRIQMIVEAYMASTTSIPLKIAGSGPLEKELKELAKEDSRIEFLGYISDETLSKYYSKAYGVIFIPYDEDYGLITIEAAMCKKPVITFLDSGGVGEFIENKVTGLVSKPNVKELSKSIDYLSQNPLLTKQMGEKVYKTVQNITWKNTIEKLLSNSEKKKQITVVSTYPIYPPRGGGQNRVFYLYKELAKTFTIEVICIVPSGEKHIKTQITPDFCEIRVPKSISHELKELEMQNKSGIPITDIAMLYLYNETPLFVDAIKNSSKNSFIAISVQPYTYQLLKEHTSIPIIHESQNVEYNLKKQMLKDTIYNKKLLEKLFIEEKEACINATFTTVCAIEDAHTMSELYQLDLKKSIVVPNGVDLNTVPYISLKDRKMKNRLYDFQNEKIILFMGSWHQPNIDAVEETFKIALKLKEYKFIIIGSVGDYFISYDIPKNVAFTGVITDEEKEIYLSVASIAINPMLTGSGTNLKMLDYMANGIPVVSTYVGARGLNIPDECIAKCDINQFDKYILNIEKHTDIQKSRTYVEHNFSWKIINENLLSELLKY